MAWGACIAAALLVLLLAAAGGDGVHCLDDGISRRALQQRRHPLRSSEFSLSDDPSVFSLLRFSVVLGCERNQKEAWVNKTPGVQCHCRCFLPVMATRELFLFLVKCWFCGFCSLPGWKLPNSNAGWHTLTLERERRFDSWSGKQEPIIWGHVNRQDV
jgi:hypothetical protein